MDCFFFIEFFLYLKYFLLRCTNFFYQVLTIVISRRCFIMFLFKCLTTIIKLIIFFFSTCEKNCCSKNLILWKCWFCWNWKNWWLFDVFEPFFAVCEFSVNWIQTEWTVFRLSFWINRKNPSLCVWTCFFDQYLKKQSERFWHNSKINCNVCK